MILIVKDFMNAWTPSNYMYSQTQDFNQFMSDLLEFKH